MLIESPTEAQATEQQGIEVLFFKEIKFKLYHLQSRVMFTKEFDVKKYYRYPVWLLAI